MQIVDMYSARVISAYSFCMNNMMQSQVFRFIGATLYIFTYIPPYSTIIVLITHFLINLNFKYNYFISMFSSHCNSLLTGTDG